MQETQIPEDTQFSEEIEFCSICMKKILPGEGRFRTNDGVFCIDCYKKKSHYNGSNNSKFH